VQMYTRLFELRGHGTTLGQKVDFVAFGNKSVSGAQADIRNATDVATTTYEENFHVEALSP
jgi:hypothetical protein